MLKTIGIIVVILIIWWIIKVIYSIHKNPVIQSRKFDDLDWSEPVLLKSGVEIKTEFINIVSAFVQKKISEGYKITKNASALGDAIRIAGRNSIYHARQNPWYQHGEVYYTSVKSEENGIIVVLIWIDKGLTYDDGYEFKALKPAVLGP